MTDITDTGVRARAAPLAGQGSAPDGTSPAGRTARTGLPARTGDARLLCALLLGLAAATSWSRLRDESDGPPSLPVHPWRVDVNHAGLAELGALPGVGPSLAARIAATRDAAPFQSIDDLRRVPGIGPVAAARIGPHVRFRR